MCNDEKRCRIPTFDERWHSTAVGLSTSRRLRIHGSRVDQTRRRHSGLSACPLQGQWRRGPCQKSASRFDEIRWKIAAPNDRQRFALKPVQNPEKRGPSLGRSWKSVDPARLPSKSPFRVLNRAPPCPLVDRNESSPRSAALRRHGDRHNRRDGLRKAKLRRAFETRRTASE